MLLALLAGIPAALWALGRDTLPSKVPSREQLLSVLANPLTADFLLGLLTIIGAIAWATFLVAVLLEVPAALGRRPARQVRGLGSQRRLAAALLGAILLTGAAPALAHASPPTSEATHVLMHTDRSLAPAAPEPAASGQEGSAQEVAADWEVHTVKPGDTLWDIAQDRLGHGGRWREIAAINYGLPQPDGRALTDAHWLQVGWHLRIPGTDHPTTPSTWAEMTEIRVQPGDTLYDLAGQHLGDGARYPEIFVASRDLAQPGGAHLTDPDIIDVGWRLLIPTATPLDSQPEDDNRQADDGGSEEDVAPVPGSQDRAPIAQPDPAEGATGRDGTPEHAGGVRRRSGPIPARRAKSWTARLMRVCRCGPPGEQAPCWPPASWPRSPSAAATPTATAHLGPGWPCPNREAPRRPSNMSYGW